MAYRIGVIGLGIMGNRMLDRLAQHADFEAAAGWDPNAEAGARTRKAHPSLVLETSADAYFPVQRHAVILAHGQHSTHHL